MISVWKIHTPQTYPKHSSTISKLAPEADSCAAWEPWEFGGSSQGSELDWNHSTISHHRGWTPSYRCTKPAWDFTICHYLRSKKYLARVGRLEEAELETSENLSNSSTGQVRGENEKNLWDQQPEIPLPTGELVDAGGSALTTSARTARHARLLELWLRLLARFLYRFNVRENSSMMFNA